MVPADRLVVVLVQPQHAGNIGSAARALNNMGLHRLVVVDPPALDMMRVRWMAPGCEAIIEQMRIVATLDEALSGVQRAIATTARHRKGHQAVHDPASFASAWWDETEGVTAILFGREDFGLSRADSDRCHALLRIPTQEHASLNLSQAVLLVAHAWFEEGRRRGDLLATGRTLGGRRGTKRTSDLETRDPKDDQADIPYMEPLADEWANVLTRIGYARGTPPERVRQTVGGLLQRGNPTKREADNIRGMIKKITWALDNPDKLPD